MISIQQLKDALFSCFKVRPLHANHLSLSGLGIVTHAQLSSTQELRCYDTEVQSMQKQAQSNCYRFTVVKELNLTYRHVTRKEEDP